MAMWTERAVKRELPWRLARSESRVPRKVAEVCGSPGALSRDDALELARRIECAGSRTAYELRQVRGVCFAALECSGVPLLAYLLPAADRARVPEVILPLMATRKPYPERLVWIVSRNLHRWRASMQREVLQAAALQSNRAVGFLFFLGLIARTQEELHDLCGPPEPRTVRDMCRRAVAVLQSGSLSAEQKCRFALLLAQHHLLQPLVVFQEPRLVQQNLPAAAWLVAPCTLLDDLLPLLLASAKSNGFLEDTLVPILISIPEAFYPLNTPRALVQAVRAARRRATQFDQLEEFAGACAAMCQFDHTFLLFLVDNFDRK